VEELQLLAITALYIGMKNEEVELSSSNSFARHTRGACTALQIACKEREILSVLGWRIYPDTPYFWLDLCIKLWDYYAVQTLPLEDRRLFKIREGTEEHEQPLLSQ